jgi:restriction endonuclease S subunit
MAIIPQPPPTTYTQGTCTGYTPVSEIFTFNVTPICNRAGDVQRQLMWLNRYGHYDYYTFKAGKDEGLNITRQTYKTWNVDWGSNNPNKTQYSRGLTDFTVSMVETHVINTGFLNQADFMFLEELYTSSDVYEIREDGGVTPINIISTEFIRKNKGNRNIVNLELSYVYSNNISLLGK